MLHSWVSSDWMQSTTFHPIKECDVNDFIVCISERHFFTYIGCTFRHPKTRVGVIGAVIYEVNIPLCPIKVVECTPESLWYPVLFVFYGLVQFVYIHAFDLGKQILGIPS